MALPIAVAPADMNAFFNGVYASLLVPPLLGVATVFFAFAAYKFFTGSRDAGERLAAVAIVIFLIAFAPQIVEILGRVARDAGGFGADAAGAARPTPAR